MPSPTGSYQKLRSAEKQRVSCAVVAIKLFITVSNPAYAWGLQWAYTYPGIFKTYLFSRSCPNSGIR